MSLLTHCTMNMTAALRDCVSAYSKALVLLLSAVLLKVCVIMDVLMGRSATGGG